MVNPHNYSDYKIQVNKKERTINTLEKEEYDDTQSLSQCAKKIGEKSLADIQSGLGYYKKLGRLLMCSAKSGNIKDTDYYIKPLVDPKDEA